MWERVKHFFRSVQRLEVQIFAAYAAYFWILAIFPAVMLIISILQYTPISPDDLRGLLERLVPASLQALTDYMIDELFAVNSPAVLSISAVVALWMTSKGILSLVRGLNRVYTARETRNPLLLRLHCVGFALAGVLAMILLLGLQLLSRDVIGVTPGIYNDTVAVTKVKPEIYNPQFIAAIQDALINIINTDEGKAIFDVYSHTGYAKAVDSDYDGARAALTAVDG